MNKAKLILSALFTFLTVSVFAQNISVSGVVRDANTGEGVPFVSVMVKGTTNGVSSDVNGNYTINAPANGVLQFSSIGYVSLDEQVNSRAKIDVVLSVDSEYLEETIVVAFGTATKESFTGSAAVVDDTKLALSQVASITDALAGAVAGVQLTSSNGAPGASSSIRIRGFSSISAGQAPLIILDGAPYEGDLSTINTADVASMTVLKDAASNALYGARGANGVIMITTKNAKRGEAVVTFDAKIGVNTKALQEYNVIRTPEQYYEMHYSAVDNYNRNKEKDPLSELESWQDINKNISGKPGNGGLGYDIWTVPEGHYLFSPDGKLNPAATLGKLINYNGEDYLVRPDNWSDYAYRQGVRSEYNVNVSGATNRSTFYASVGYLENQGITAKSDMSRLSARLRADYQAKDWIKVGGNFSFSNYEYNSLRNNGSSVSTGNVWAYTSQMAPIYPLYLRNADGSIKVDSNGFEMMDYGNGMNAGFNRNFIGDANPLMDNMLNTNNSIGNQFIASGFADIDLFKGLTLTVNGTASVDETRFTNVYNPYYGQFDTTGGTVSKEHDRNYTYNLQQLLNYNRSFGLNNISLLLGHEYYNRTVTALWASKSQMFSQDNLELSGAAVDGKSSGSTLSQYNNEGFFARGQYDYDNRFFLSASFRRDASSVFHPDHRWGNFWSAGGAWIVSKESWFAIPVFDELKLKASIGSQGNDNIGNYMYTDRYTIVNSDGKVATLFDAKGSKDITWETNTNFNAGAEFSIAGRVSGSLEYFNRLTTDMLFSFPVAPSLGYSSYYANVGDMRNYGAELDLNINLVNSKNFKWNVNANLTYLKNNIVMIDDEKETLTAYDAAGNEYKGYQSGSFFIGEDVSLYSWYLKEYAGVNKETGESLWYMDELDEEGNRTGNRVTTSTWADADYYVNGETSIAPFYGGFGTSFEFFGFDLSANFTYQVGGKMYDSSYATFMSSPTGTDGGNNFHVDLYKAWTQDNKDSDIPRLQFEDSYTAASSTRFLTTGSYLNVQNVNFGYTFPERLTKNLNIASLRLYLSAENLLYISARRGFDPRQGYSSSDASSYSPMRTVSGGVTIKF